MVRLVISDNEGSTTVVPLLRDEVTIGRKEGNTIRLTERNISRRHVQLVRIGGVYKLRDLDSYNGVMVNGRKVEGESPLANGDQIQLGDYTIVVEEEASAARTLPPSAQSVPPPRAAQSHATPQPSHAPPEPSVLQQSRRPAVPARLVMLTQPASGAEFVLPTDRSARLGRSDDVDCPINHRSVSREHAEIKREGEQFVIEDLGSANGITVNGRQIKSVELRSGDIIELGQVVFRYVGAGEHYFFDPGEATRFRGTSSNRRGANTRLAILLGAVTLAAIVFILLPTPDAPQDDGSSGSDLAAVALAGDDAANAAEPTGPEDGYDRAILACRSALAAARFAEAAAHASMALKVRPEAKEALECRQHAESQAQEEQTYVRGRDALQRGDVETATQEFARLPETSLFRAKSEVPQAVSELARARLQDARAIMSTNRGDAARLAQSVLLLPGVPPDAVGQAEQLLAEARGTSGARGQEIARGPKQPAPPPVAPVRPATPVATARPSAPPSAPVARPVAPARPPQPAAPSVAVPAPGGAAAFEIAQACVARGDNECVIRALESNASSPQALRLLIETYRTTGDVARAQKNMAVFVKRYPDESSAKTYRRMLELQQSP